MIFDTLQQAGIPCVYSHFTQKKYKPPYIIYTGGGQNTFSGDDTIIWRENEFQIEYYFTEKDIDKESQIEEILLDAGYQYTKSEDVYIEDQRVYVIYYQI